MNKRIEYLSTPVFYLSGRRKITNLRNVNINANGIMLNYSIINDKPVLYESSINISNEKAIQTLNNDIFIACINLGEFVYKNSDILKDFLNCYKNFQKYEQQKFNEIARGFKDTIKTDNIIKLKEPKYAENKTFKRLLTKWLVICGISEKDVEKITLYNNHAILPINSLLDILKLSLEIYKLYLNYYVNGNFENTVIDVKYSLEYNNGNFDVKRSTNSILNLVKLMMISYYKNEIKNLRTCEYCNAYFFGRKDKKYCSARCKSRKKYEKKKEKHKGGGA